MKNSIILTLLALTKLCNAQEVQDMAKRDENLFHPTPKSLMRSFETDRPDVTESPYTVNAGHFQLETDLFKTERSKTGGVNTIQNSYNVANLKVGITNSLDLQFVLESFVTKRTTENNAVKFESGFGNLSFRAKQNIWGNDNGKTAMSILPFINIPATRNEKITGGLVVPFSLSLPNDWGFGSQIESDFNENKTGKSYHFDFLASATISHSIFSNLDFFAETLISRDGEEKSYEYLLNGGLVYYLKENLKIDTGIYYGIKKTSSKTYFVGLSFRL